jgi:DNA helicase II / ATP-dependent DNA helicase PcrA
VQSFRRWIDPKPVGRTSSPTGLLWNNGNASPHGGFARNRAPLTFEGELIAKSTGTNSDFATGDRVFHQKFGYGRVTLVDGNKLTIAFDKAGEKRVVDSFVEKA